MMKHTIQLLVNGKPHTLEVESRRLLVQVLRDDLGLTGTKRGCESSICGACTVLLDGQSVHACSILAVQANGKSVTTIEGLGTKDHLHPVQKAFYENQGYQCGFCTPGVVMSAVALLNDDPRPTPEEVRLGMAGNLCRCTGYVKIIKSVLAAAEAMALPDP
jgi:aerobic-type carbon monoxide dehydrogenase small subunit (CoxS/CutS family)